MIKKTVTAMFIFLALCAFSLVGCENPGEGGMGCDRPTNYQELEIALPPISLDTPAVKYMIELTEPISANVIVTKEGLPGQTLVFVLVDPQPRVNVKVTAFDYADVLVDVAELVVVNVDVMGGKVVVDVVVDPATGKTNVDVHVEDKVDVDVDVDPTAENDKVIVDVSKP